MTTQCEDETLNTPIVSLVADSKGQLLAAMAVWDRRLRSGATNQGTIEPNPLAAGHQRFEAHRGLERPV